MFPACNHVDPSILKLNTSYDTILNILLQSNDLDLNFIKVKYKMTKRKLEMIDSSSTLVRTLEKIGECNAFDKFHTVEFLAVFVNNNELKDLVAKHRNLLDDTDYDWYLITNKYAAKIGEQANEKVKFITKEAGLSEKDVNAICKYIGLDKWKPLARHMKDVNSQYIFNKCLISEIDSKNTTTELKLREVMKRFLEKTDGSSARKELINVLIKIKRRDLAKSLETS
ncbi:hypothetical protein LSTR_LSTR012466 [Laodelphax striatellus]|uniref:Death domain-containing protein n=1 Tax=Laodelphax striatellus TaxID=195883 RepID=A0A482XSJ7_LAOST|nr:hypothetical protein LSTR_LSTR012466 [Laodelphax striatellus]